MDNNSTILSNNFTEYRPVILEDNINLKDYKSIPIGQFSALGLSFESIAAALNSISTAGGGSGLYWVKVPSGTHLAALKNGSGYIGGALSNTTNQVAAQSTLSKLAFNPTMLFISIAL